MIHIHIYSDSSEELGDNNRHNVSHTHIIDTIILTNYTNDAYLFDTVTVPKS
jgi:hypothetical protein